ncbi:putative sulfate exporter family transporter [uncultured Roseobacter sp.]|uniref:YeiH family protein n=1 Tax=uncultured Roseobacter sp. TaxID=114847 RepID=UPI00262EC76D|nr:putative sulfate exporter family transporter [uncultured Roseobacter sp.]
MADTASHFVRDLPEQARTLFPGVIVAVIVAITAQFLADHYEAPAMLMALLLGIAVAFLGDEGKTVAGIGFAARTVLRMGIAFLGVRISFDLMAGLGIEIVLLVIGGVLATIAFGLAISRLFGHGWRFAFLTAGSVAICGASAAMAIAAILPRDDKSEQRLIFTVLGVTVLSTVAMIAYPILVTKLDLGDTAGGIFLGATIHDVAQVVGAGFSLSENAGDTATLVKLIRVSMLAPVVLIGALLIRAFADAPADGKRPPLLPFFVIGFLILATLNSLGLIPTLVADLMSQASRWMLLIAIAAVGMKTNLKRVLAVGGPAIALLVTETLFIAGLILAGITYFA